MSIWSNNQTNPSDSHWIDVKNILQYLRRTEDAVLSYGEGELEVTGFTVASFLTDKTTISRIKGIIKFE